MKSFHIGQSLIGEGEPAFIIAEVGQNHDGSLGLAHSYIDAAAEAGADAIKFQTHIANMESSREDKFRVNFSKQDATRQDYWRRMEFTQEQWAGLSDHARQTGIIFLSSAFSVAAVELLSRIGMPAWKVGSGEFQSNDLLEAMQGNGAPILFSTGMSTWSEIDEAVSKLGSNGDLGLFQCTSQYPTPLENVGLNVLNEMKARYDHPIGLSDHTGTIFPALSALAMGVTMLELHLTFDKRMFGPDVVASLTVEQLKLICDARDAHQKMMLNPVDKNKMAENLTTMRSLFTKSLSPAYSLTAGTILTSSMLIPKKPGTGISPSHIEELVGKRLKRDIEIDELIKLEDLE